ncbi:MAG: sugar phosphate isomerase/epimerase, partial [Armatimonadetes bacterium]|nr:sugar phosphate isomerase/epimerase [Armatimonadota bacterium]
VGRRLKSLGLNYGYHNHSHEFEKFGERTAMAILFGESDPDCVSAELDTYWVQHGGASPVVWIKKLADRLPLLHLKDMAMRGREQLYAEVGEGNLDWEGIIAAAQDAGVKWYIVEQDTCQRDPFESLAISFNNLKEMGLE